jgi:hypothetical protein
MTYSTKPVLREDLSVVEKEEFSTACICAKCTPDKRKSIFIRNKTIFSSERMLYKDYYHKGSVEERISGHESQGA